MKISLQAGVLLGAGMLTAFSSVAAFAQYDMTDPMQVPPASSSFSSTVSSAIDVPPASSSFSSTVSSAIDTLPIEKTGVCTCSNVRIRPTENNQTCQESKRSNQDICLYIEGNSPKCICTLNLDSTMSTASYCALRSDILNNITCTFREND